MTAFRRSLLRWYRTHGRDLPWRHRPTPYRVWVSEVMLQQTTVATVQRRYEQWMDRFPDVASVARATQRQVLAAWEGMGYYRRALNLWRAARIIVRQYGGQMPRTRRELLALPGVGPYIAAALRSFAFGEDELALEANVSRVFMRLLGLKGSPQDAGVRRAVVDCDRRGLPPGRSSVYNQALMDFGSLVCKPTRPGCDPCFAAGICEAYRQGLQDEIPARKRKRLKKIQTAVAVFVKDGQVYLQRRAHEGRFAGMWEFPGGKVEQGETPAAALAREIKEELGVRCTPTGALAPILHRYTEFQVRLHGFLCRPPARLPLDAAHRWVPLSRLGRYPMPSANRKLIEAVRERLARSAGPRSSLCGAAQAPARRSLKNSRTRAAI